MILNQFRIIAILEGWSYLILIFIAMPLKYLYDMPIMVKYSGWLHGFLFILFVVYLPFLMFKLKWSFIKTTIAFISSLLPFGTFILDYYWIKPHLK
jgi:integral membrane protein